MRWLHGSVTLVDREGQPLPPACGEAEREGSEVVGLSQDDVRTTEVHFFREDDPSTPLVSYAAVDPSPCGGGSTAPHGRYAKVRYGPSTLDSRFGQSRRNLQRLVPGDRLVVFAINHATGHTGMEVLTVPSVNFSSRAPDGSCPADDAAGGPQPVTDGERTVHLSRCTLQDLGIQANIKLYPPEIDVRVDRRARAEGTPQGDMEPSFVRHGGAATTRDDFVRVATHWRVRRGPASSWDAGVLPPADPSCDGGVQQDGGFCAPQPLYDEGQRGRLLERYCAELPEPRTPEQQALCLRDDSLLAEVPAGVPPLAGRVVRITGSAAEEPAVASFHISPGRSTAAVQTSLRQVDRDGREVVLNNLVSANYYVQVVGHPVLPRDRNRDGTIDPSEENAPPPDFADGEDAPGLPDKAVALKNVYRSLEPQGRMERYDRAREHEFRVLKVEGPGEVTAITDRGEARPLPRPGEPPSSAAASPEDVAYQFLLHLMEPEDPGRAGTLSGKYVLRLGSDSFGIECPIELDEAAGTLRGTCEGEYLPEVLSAGDILYLELYLRGNAENVLYRFNFDGLSKREDYLAAASQYTAESAVEKKDGKPVLGRPVSRPGEAHFFLSPQQFSSGRIRLCTNEDCSGSDSLIKEALLQMGSNGRYTVQEVEGGQATARLVQDETPGAAGARRFRQALPATLALMPGARAGAAPSRVFLVKDSVTPLPGHTADQLGHPKGNFQGLHVDAQGQESLMGINLASLSLSFSHTDFKVPQFAKAMSFSRSYDNQSDLISPLGVGWSHSYDGFVVEEELGRYVAVLRGQAWSFLKCAQRNPEAQTASQCETDKSHGMELEVDEQGVHLKSPDGEEYRFDRLAVKRDTEGRRKWLLTKFHDGHGRDGDAGWTQLTYAHGSNRLIQVARTPGALGLELEYEDIPQDAAAAINALARQEDFQFLKKVTLKNGEMTLHAGTFLHDKQGNLLEANGTTGSPSRTWRYTYKEVPANVESAKAWRAVNELSAASLMVGEGTEWSASYERNGAECYQHLEPFECVTRVDASGPSGDSIQVSGTLSERSITMPGGSSARAGLNLYGNVTSFQEQGQNAWTLSWASSVRGQPVRLESMVTSYNLTMDFSHDDKLRLSGVSVRGPTSLTAESLFTVTARQNGLPTGGTMAVAGSQVSWQTPRNASGDMESLRIGSHTLGTWVHDAEGRILQAEDRAGNTWEVTSFGHPLGLPTGVRVTSPAQPGTTQESYAMSTAYDPHGQMTLLANERTGLRQQWTYDGLGRVTGSVQGVPSVPGPGAVQTWSFEYSHSGAQTTLVERMAESGFEQTKVLQEGRLQSQTVSYGGQLATRSYSYEGGRLSQMTDERGAVRSFTYDGAGRLLRVDVDGQLEAAYQWNAQGQATALTDGEGRTVYVEYDGFGRPATVRHSDGQQETVRRDSQGNILWRQLSTPGSEPHTYEYERSELGQLLSVRSEGGASNGVELQTAYDSAGRPVTREDRVTGVTESFEYNDLLGRMTRHVRSIPSGASVLTWDERRVYSDAPGWTDLVIRRTIDTGQGSREEEQRLRLDVRGRVLRSEVPGSGAYEYTYDAQGNMLTERHSVLGLLASYSYDERGQLLSATGADGAATSYLRDASGRVLHQYGPHPEEHWAFEYDSKGRPTRRTLSASGNTPAAIWQLSYPGEGSVYEWDPLGYLTARTLDARGLLLSRVRMASPQPDSQRQCELFAYDGEQVKSRIVRMDSCDPDEATWEARQERTHDARGRVLWEQERWFQGHQEQYTYTTHTSWSGRTASVQQSWVPLGAPARQVAATMELDGLGNMVSRSQGGGTDEWLYDAAGLLVSELPAGRPARLLSYAQGRLMQETYGAEITAYAYDGAGRRQSKTDPSGRVRSWEYDSGGRVASERFGRAGETLTRRYTYEAGGGLKTMQRGEGPEAAVWTFQHGPRRELQSVTLPAAVGAFQFQYDAALQLTAIQPPPGSVTPAQTFAYDFLGRQTRRTRGPSVWTTAWQGGTAIQVDPNEDVVETLLDGRGRTARRIYRPGPSSQEHTDLMQVAAAYDGTDQLMAVTETRHSGSVSHVYEYDARSRLISLQHGDDTVSYSYTEGGQRQSVTSPSGSVQYVYDALGRLGQMNSSQGPAVSMIWEPGGLLSESNGNGVVERYVYSGQGMIRSITAAWGEGPGNSMRHEYDYDTRGNRLEERYTAPGAAALQVTQYGYDLANRLTGVRYSSNDSELYALGVDGSRLEEKRVQGYLGSLGPEGLTTAENPHQYWRYSYDTAGGLLRIDDLVAQPARVEANLTTDPAGRLISEQRGAAARQFHWDGAGRLASVSVTGTESPTTVSYTYAFDGLRRTRTDESGAQVRYVWGVDELLEEGPASGPRARYTEGGRLVVAAGNERLLHDGLGSVVGRAGTPPLLSRYGAWGELREGTAPQPGQPSQAFAELSLDTGARLFYAQQRWYDPVTGRFLSEDPLLAGLASPWNRTASFLAQPMAFHPHTYAATNPVNAVDPTGLYQESIHGALTYYLAIYAGFDWKQAAMIALGNAAVDHDPHTQPVDLGNIVSGVTKDWHFDPAAQSNFEKATPGKSASGDAYREWGRKLHTLMDMGFDQGNARGPHSNGRDYKSDMIGHPMRRHCDGTTGAPWSPSADHPFRDRDMNYNVLAKIFNLLVSQGGNKRVASSKYVEKVIRYAVDMNTREDFKKFIETPPVPGAPSYKEIVAMYEKDWGGKGIDDQWASEAGIFEKIFGSEFNLWKKPYSDDQQKRERQSWPGDQPEPPGDAEGELVLKELKDFDCPSAERVGEPGEQ
ncbi:RHS repeat-associated core domain-containing protein [Hyalangium sp.]|uniref:RHS repeat-associated core domain-containing protein n=1 Tax=Hyalangium sp. TaxID=2028555 RepID=UPI002D56C55B|nr:RHS repeat-associated core domain-containing protein [Hyalangium sp.]HYH95020.1 RHS repeat-associated core domain-containing protein [Hyalangium sp.]